MAVTMKQVRNALDPDEPDYPRAAELGAEALPHLDALIEGDDSQLAAKAASLAGMISAAGSSAVLEKAARHTDARVRVSAAAACRNLSGPEASHLLSRLIGDSDIGVQKVALQSVPPTAVAELRDALERLPRLADPSIANFIHAALVRIGLRSAQAEGDMPSGKMSGAERDQQSSMPSGNMGGGQ